MRARRARTLSIGALLVGAPFAHGACVAQQVSTGMQTRGITAVEGIEVGHHTLAERPTGCTVVLARAGAVGGVDVRGSSPGTREIALLDPVNTVSEVNAVVLSGGSAFGLDAATGVMRWLDERDIGYRVGSRVVPIVVGAILYDLGLEGNRKIRPGPECGYAAADAASSDALAEGSVGAGAGATVGKLGGGRSMKGGFGTASITLPSGLTVGAAVAVNAVGDVVDPATGEIVAGALDERGRFLDVRVLLRSGNRAQAPGANDGANTTIGVVATNAALTKAQATKVAQMAQDGLARAIYPAHTTGDGDIMFALATGRWTGEPDVTLIGALAADVVAEAILRAVRLAEGLPGIPSVSDLSR
ncbi:MAG TPA: P1 family peptidase [Longimicrobiales bacterium]|nr:P1 family peptidase [Longimicrobiales bacterium]